MVSKDSGDRSEHDSEATEAAGADGGVDAGADTAFDRLLHEAAKVSSPGRLLAPGTQRQVELAAAIERTERLAAGRR